MSGDDGLRKAIAWELWRPGARLYRDSDRLELADAVLALPELAALRAKAAAADRVRELHQAVDIKGRNWSICKHDGDEWPCQTLRALDGPPC